MATIEAKQGRGFLARFRSSEAKTKPTPTQEWEQAFDAKRGNLPLERLNNGRVNITVQEYEGIKMAHFDKGHEYLGRVTVAVDTNSQNAYIIGAVVDQEHPTGHSWELRTGNVSQNEKFLKDNAAELKKAQAHNPDDPKKRWRGAVVENDRIYAAIQKSKLR